MDRNELVYVGLTGLISGGGFSAFWTWLSGRRKEKAKTEKFSAEAIEVRVHSDIQIGNAWKEYAAEMRNRMREFEEKLEDARTDAETMLAENKRLKKLLQTNGINHDTN